MAASHRHLCVESAARAGMEAVCDYGWFAIGCLETAPEDPKASRKETGLEPSSLGVSYIDRCDIARSKRIWSGTHRLDRWDGDRLQRSLGVWCHHHDSPK